MLIKPDKTLGRTLGSFADSAAEFGAAETSEWDNNVFGSWFASSHRAFDWMTHLREQFPGSKGCIFVGEADDDLSRLRLMDQSLALLAQAEGDQWLASLVAVELNRSKLKDDQQFEDLGTLRIGAAALAQRIFLFSSTSARRWQPPEMQRLQRMVCRSGERVVRPGRVLRRGSRGLAHRWAWHR